MLLSRCANVYILLPDGNSIDLTAVDQLDFKAVLPCTHEHSRLTVSSHTKKLNHKHGGFRGNKCEQFSFLHRFYHLGTKGAYKVHFAHEILMVFV